MTLGEGNIGGAEYGTSFSAPVGESDLVTDPTPNGGDGVAYLPMRERGAAMQ